MLGNSSCGSQPDLYLTCPVIAESSLINAVECQSSRELFSSVNFKLYLSSAHVEEGLFLVYLSTRTVSACSC